MSYLSLPSLRPAPDYVKNLLPDYEITHILGVGGYAKVYKAIGPKGKEYALKVPKTEDIFETMGIEVINRFKSEAEIWMRLKHPNIVTLHSSNTEPLPYMAMELMDGGNLKQLMKEHTLSIGESLHIMQQILKGLSFAHRMASVHRDLKPENILFTSDGIAKITDWGIGKFMASVGKSQTMGIKGTLEYCAPEQYEKQEYGKVDWQTDIFQMGIVFYELLTGENPFTGESIADCVGKVLRYDPQPPSALNSDVPLALDEVIMKAIAKKKEDRWESGGIMLHELNRVISGKTSRGPKCSECGNIIDSGNRKLRCKECRKYFCETCEGWIDKVSTHNGYKVKVKYPLCEDCYNKAVDESKKWIDDFIKKKESEKKNWREVDGNRPNQVENDKNKEMTKKKDICPRCGHEMKPGWWICPGCQTMIDLAESDVSANHLNERWNEAEVLKNKGNEAFTNRDFSAAVQFYMKALQNNPGHDGAWNNMGLAYRSMNDLKSAIKCFVKAIEINPNNSSALASNEACEYEMNRTLLGLGDRKEEEPVKSAGKGEPACPDCRGKIRHIAQYNRWYCDACKRYMSIGFMPKEAKGNEWINSIGMKFVPIPGKNYYMGKYTVTQKEWRAVMGATPWKGKSFVKEGDDYPATYILWSGCQQFVKKLNSKEGRNRYRLPTGEEWEHACRAGSTTKYCFGDDAGRLGDYAWYRDNAKEVGEKYAHRVGQKKLNQWGLYDMHGNVWEWTSTADGSVRVLRGGCCFDSANGCRSAFRYDWHPDYRFNFLGFRLVRSSD